MIIRPHKGLVVFGSLLALMSIATEPLRAADRLIAGEYQATVTVDGKTQTFTHCVTAAEARWVNADAKAGRQYIEKALNGACTMKAYDVTGDTVSYTMACGPNITKCKTTYHGDHFEGSSTSTFGTPDETTSRGKSKRTGSTCTRPTQPGVWTWLRP
ncbi:MAG: DUF3617 domain-containing protein [Acidobacteriota bacterium]|nr:DUF3617 domain-containing protein [Acidobacteriota bacterium]